MIATLAGIVCSGTAMSIGASYGTVEDAWTMFWALCGVLIPLGIGGLMKDRAIQKAIEPTQRKYTSMLNGITERYNTAITNLESQFNRETRSYVSPIQKEHLRLQFDQQYQAKRDAYKLERNVIESAYNEQEPRDKKSRGFWKKLFVFGFIAQLSACGYSVGALTEAEEEAGTVWNADNIPMPHLTDRNRYVSNPDSVVSENTERLLNEQLKKLDDSLQIESVMILVNNIENDDPFRFAQDVGNKYGVGKNDRGLIIVLGYLDHSINISPGRSLEADLTDVECHRLEQQYVIPSMKAEQPDSGMLYLAEAIYNLMEKKDLPTMTVLPPHETDDEDESLMLIALYWILMGCWIVLSGFVSHRHGIRGGLSLIANPFARAAVYASTGGGFGGGGSFGGGGGSFGGGGGSFGGGSFGGGGATSRW